MGIGEWALVAALLALIAVLGVLLHRCWSDNATARREIGRLRDLAVRRADQVSVLSHEIRTPLALIKGSADLLVEESPGPLTDPQRRFVTTISASAEHLISLAEDLLIQARIEAGLFQVNLRRVELRGFLRSVVRELRQVHGGRVVLDVPGPPTRVMLDPQLIQQLITNLVNNALRHDPDPEGRAVVRGQVVEGNVVLAISDHGPGMSEAERARLFERFRSSAALGEGTGIGLYICRHIAELHGGTVMVDTIAHHGTTMLVTFPAGVSDER
ncbi:MAG: HAMP domain-containing histidine kinase [Micropruina sp.]|nr:MAG: HAMP domain-containing histidine kinase [Micropruina sp.]